LQLLIYIRRGLEPIFDIKIYQKRLRSIPNAQTKPRQSGEQCAHGRRANSRVLHRQVLKIVIERLQSIMIDVKTTPEFDEWMRGLRDGLTRRRLAARLRKASFGLLGDVQPVGSGVMEMREHFGPGWRMYYVQYGSVMIVMLGGGDKSSQAGDIAKAQTLAQLLE
jgi:putative addiction module killer protein